MIYDIGTFAHNSASKNIVSSGIILRSLPMMRLWG